MAFLYIKHPQRKQHSLAYAPEWQNPFVTERYPSKQLAKSPYENVSKAIVHIVRKTQNNNGTSAANCWSPNLPCQHFFDLFKTQQAKRISAYQVSWWQLCCLLFKTNSFASHYCMAYFSTIVSIRFWAPFLRPVLHIQLVLRNVGVLPCQKPFLNIYYRTESRQEFACDRVH